MPPESLRLFTALRVPAHLQTAMQPDVRPGGWRWVQPEGLHVTLVFLGDVLATELPAMAAALRPLGRFPALHLRAEGLSGFPDPYRARVLVRHVPEIPALTALQAENLRLLTPWQHAGKHAHYRPHVTLARHKLGAAVPDLVLPPLDWTAREVVLIESVRNSQGARYVDRLTITLGNDTCG